MNCPLCLDTVLDVTYHAGIELDICPKCRGVWLDRGELNRIVDELDGRSVGPSAERRDDRPGPSAVRRDDQSGPSDRDRQPRRDHEYDRSDRSHKKRKQSFASRLGDVFEEIIDL